MDTADSMNFSALSPEQLNALSEEGKAIYLLLAEKDRAFFSNTFSAADLPAALARKGDILKRNQAQRARLAAIQEAIRQAAEDAGSSAMRGVGLGEFAGGAAAMLGIGAAAATIATDGSAIWKGVPPRLIANALEQQFDNAETTDIEVDGPEESLTATIYLKPPNGERYVPALTVNLNQTQDTTLVKVSDLTSESFIESARQGGQRLLELAGKGFFLWQRRRGIFSGDAINLAQSALDTAFDAAQVAKDLNIKDRVWKVIKETADEREKAWAEEAKRARIAREELIHTWQDYRRCPRCGEPYAEADSACRICGRGRNSVPSQPEAAAE